MIFNLNCDRKLECVGKFYHLGDMIGPGGGADEASRVRGSNKKNDLQFFTARGASLKVKGKVYSKYILCVMVYGSDEG